MTEAPTVRQNDIDRTKTDNTNRTSKQGMAIYKLTIIWTGILQQTVLYVNNPAHSALLNSVETQTKPISDEANITTKVITYTYI